MSTAPTINTDSGTKSEASWYTKDLMVEETWSPQLSLSPSPANSPQLGVAGRTTQAPALQLSSPPPSGSFSFPIPPRSRVASSSALLSVPSKDESNKHKNGSNRKRRRSFSDSLVASGNSVDADDELDIEEVSSEDDAAASASDGDDVEESGEEADSDHIDNIQIDSSPRTQQTGTQGHESGPPSPPAVQFQHGMIENPDGTAFYRCKFCQQTWPQSHFRNAQQFGAHCSNCSRKRKVKDPQDMTTTTRERSKRMRESKRSRSMSASTALLDQTRDRLIDSDGSGPESSEFPAVRKLRKTARRLHSKSMLSSRGEHHYPRYPNEARLFETAKSSGEGMPGELNRKNKNIFALLAYVKSELARIKEEEDSEQLELSTREMVQDTRAEWGARIQALRVDAVSDLRAHTASLPRRVERLAALHPAHKENQAAGKLDYILNDSSKEGNRSTPVRTSTESASVRTNHHHHHHQQQQKVPEVLSLGASQQRSKPTMAISAPLAARAALVTGSSCVPPSTASSSLKCTSPMPTPL